MKRIFNKLRRDEKGQALIIALILMLVGGLIIAPVLAYVGSGLKIGKEVHEERMMELYAADAGVEDALWQIKQPTPDPNKVPSTVGQFLTYPLSSTVNGKTIDVTIYWISGDIGAGTYKVTSVAPSAGVPNTTIESYVQTLPLFWTNAATSCNDVNIKPGAVINGPVVEGYDPNKWPFTPDFNQFYFDQVSGLAPFGNTLDVKDYPTPGPLRTTGKLDIYNKIGSAGDTATLSGTVYVTGDLNIGNTNKDFTLDLNYHTIYCESNSVDPKYAIKVGGKCTIKGSGCIIAIGDIDFQPNILSSSDDFIFIMSVSGRVWFHPNGDFYGSVAGNADIDLWPGNTFTHTDPPIDPNTGEIMLNFPMGDVASALEIRTWEIKLN